MYSFSSSFRSLVVRAAKVTYGSPESAAGKAHVSACAPTELSTNRQTKMSLPIVHMPIGKKWSALWQGLDELGSLPYPGYEGDEEPARSRWLHAPDLPA